MQKARYVAALGIPLLALLSFTLATAWTGPTAAPPGNNISAPINVGNVDQVKNGGLGVNALAVFGNSLFGGSTGSNAYLNFGATSGSTGYGIRDNAGTVEFKNSGDTSGSKNGWYSLQELVFNLCSGGACGGGGGGTGTPMVFSVSKGTTDQAVTPATWTKLTWPNVILDTNNNFANDRFTPTVCGFRRLRTGIPIDCGQGFRSIADSIPVIADSGSHRRLQRLTLRFPCQACHACRIFPLACAGSRR